MSILISFCCRGNTDDFPNKSRRAEERQRKINGATRVIAQQRAVLKIRDFALNTVRDQDGMSTPEISYEFHDSVIASVSMGPEREVAFIVDMYPVFYPDKPRVVVRFGRIVNYEKVRSYVEQLEAEADQEYMGCRIDCLQYDTKKESKAHSYWFFLQTAWGGAVRIHCSEMSITETQHSDCELVDAPDPETP